MTLRLAVLDYEAGNVRSAKRGFDAAGADAFITGDPVAARTAAGLVIPGVGNVASCLANLTASGLQDLVREWIESERPVFGICVGMQLLYAHSEEGDTMGLGLLPGRVERFDGDIVVPHMGWDEIAPSPGSEHDPLLGGITGERFYFVHSYYAVPEDSSHVVATCAYGGADFPCLVREGSVVGTQFHPEKSGGAGARLLSNWVRSLR